MAESPFLRFGRILAAVCLHAVIACSAEQTPQASGQRTVDAGGSRVSDSGPVSLRITVRNVSVPGTYKTSAGDDLPVVFAPGVDVVHPSGSQWFTDGQAASPGLEHLAEDGNPKDAQRELETRDIGVVGVFGADKANISYDDSPIEPGGEADFLTDAQPGDLIELGMMWSQSNDVFVATPPGGVPLFDENANPVASLTGLSLWDAGTEMNQEPGAGSTQAPRQSAPGEGTQENGVIRKLEGDKDVMGFQYPPLADTLEIVVSREQ